MSLEAIERKREALLKEVIKTTKEKRKLHLNDPAISKYWDKLIELLSVDLEDTKYVLERVGEENLYQINEVFDDISYIFQSKEFILLLEELSKKYPQLDLETDIKWAKEMMNES